MQIVPTNNCTLATTTKNYVVTIQIIQSIAPFLHEFASYNHVQHESLIFGTATSDNLTIPSNVTAQDLMRDHETSLTVLVRDRDWTSRRRGQSAAPASAILSPASPDQKIAVESSEPA